MRSGTDTPGTSPGLRDHAVTARMQITARLSDLAPCLTPATLTASMGTQLHRASPVRRVQELGEHACTVTGWKQRPHIA